MEKLRKVESKKTAKKQSKKMGSKMPIKSGRFEKKLWEPKHPPPNPDERPIMACPRGKYNLKFIDWENEFEAVADYISDPHATENPCGIDEKVFEALVRQDLGNYPKLRDGLSEDSASKIKCFRAKSTSAPSVVCCICIEKFLKDQVLVLLPCGHQFHDKCIQDWLKDHHICPMCRSDLNEQQFLAFDHFYLAHRYSYLSFGD